MITTLILPLLKATPVFVIAFCAGSIHGSPSLDDRPHDRFGVVLLAILMAAAFALL